MKKAIRSGEIYKHAVGIYSDKKYVSELAIIRKRYSKAVFTLQSAFFYHGLTDTIPLYYYLETDKDAAKIKDDKVIQIFDNNNSLDLGSEKLIYSGEEIIIFSKERMLVELIRNRSKFSFDYYKEIIGNYRKLMYEIDFYLVEEYAGKMPKSNLVMNTVQMEVL